MACRKTPEAPATFRIPPGALHTRIKGGYPACRPALLKDDPALTTVYFRARLPNHPHLFLTLFANAKEYNQP